MRIRCQFFPSWIPFEHSNFSLRLQPHSPIKPDWSDLRDLNFDCIQFSGFRTQWCNARSSLRCPCTIDWQFSRPARLIFRSGAFRPIGNIRTHRVRVETIFGGLPCRRSLTPCVSPSRAPVLSFARYFQAPATQASCFQSNINIACRNTQNAARKYHSLLKMTNNKTIHSLINKGK